MSAQPADARALLAASMTEREWQAQAHDLLRMMGYVLVYHTQDSRHSEPGFPDTIAIRIHPTPRLFVAEWKAEKGRPTPAQNVWLAAFCAVGVDARVWRPSQIAELTEVLR